MEVKKPTSLGGNSIGFKKGPKKPQKSPKSQIEKDACIKCFKSIKKGPKKPERQPKNGLKIAQMSVILLKCLPAVLEAVEHGSLGVDVAPAQDGDAEVERGLDHVPGLAAARRHLVQDHVGGAPVSQTTLGRVEFNQCSQRVSIGQSLDSKGKKIVHIYGVYGQSLALTY